MRKPIAFSLILLLALTPICTINVRAYSDHPDLFVSAENSLFENYFSGAMVVEVIVKDTNISPIDQQKGEPIVTLNGKQLRMVQGSSGDWYAFFANVDKAKQADQISLAGMPGQNLDFGVFCDRSTSPSVLGVSFSQTDGIAIPDSNGISGTTQGTSSFNACTGNFTSTNNQMNVIRNIPSLNTNPNVNTGQIGIKANAWPFIQLFTFSNSVTIEYDKAGGSETVNLTYEDMTDISLKLDKSNYPQNSDVFATINDMQLNEDPTAIDSWTFNVNSPVATFYQAFPDSGSSPGGSSLVNLYPSLSNLGFKDNGYVGMDLGSVVELRTNQVQTSSSITNGPVIYNKIVTFIETSPNSGIFESSSASKSTIGIINNAPRFQSGAISYNSEATSIVSGTADAQLSLGTPSQQFNPGQKEPITLVDSSQNLNSALIEHLDDFRSSAIIPTLKIGNPVTLNTASNVQFYPNSSGFAGGLSIPSSVQDPNSARLIIDTTATPSSSFKKITLNLGITAGTLKNLFIDTNQPNSNGTNWINYDLRSFQLQLGVNSFSDTSMTLYFGALGSNPIQILSPGSISSGNGLAQISDANVARINTISSSPVFLEINFDTSGSPANGGMISSETDTQPIVFDLFSFGNKNAQNINNAIYRGELQETSSNSGVFTGTMEYAVANQLNQYDPNLIKSLRTFSNQIKFLVNDQMVDEKGMKFTISSVSSSGGNIFSTSQSNAPTHSGIVSLGSQSYRLGQPVIMILNDPDLNLDSHTIETYSTVNDPNSPADDTVGDTSGNTLLEIWIKGFRFHHCTVNGVAYGGLAATGFTLTETGPSTGIFQGSFKMPSQICNEAGTALISPVGGSIEAWYHDFKDALGRSVTIGLTSQNPAYPSSTPQSYQPQPSPVTATNKISITPQMTDNLGRLLLEKPAVGKVINFRTDISNNDNFLTRGYSYIVQVKDDNDVVVYIKLVEGYVDPSNKKTAEISWVPQSTGKYTVEIFVWDKNGMALPLTQKTEYTVEVVSK